MTEQRGMFGAKLKALRESAGLTQEQLAERSGMHKLGVAKIEQGLREPSWATVQSLADALGVSCEAFKNVAGVSNDAPPAPRPRGRPAKAPASAQDEQAAVKPVDEPMRGKKASKGKPRKRKGQS